MQAATSEAFFAVGDLFDEVDFDSLSETAKQQPNEEAGVAPTVFLQERKVYAMTNGLLDHAERLKLMTHEDDKDNVLNYNTCVAIVDQEGIRWESLSNFQKMYEASEKEKFGVLDDHIHM